MESKIVIVRVNLEKHIHSNKYNGHLRFQSEVGQGALFAIKKPVIWPFRGALRISGGVKGLILIVFRLLYLLWRHIPLLFAHASIPQSFDRCGNSKACKCSDKCCRSASFNAGPNLIILNIFAKVIAG